MSWHFCSGTIVSENVDQYSSEVVCEGSWFPAFEVDVCPNPIAPDDIYAVCEAPGGGTNTWTPLGDHLYCPGVINVMTAANLCAEPEPVANNDLTNINDMIFVSTLLLCFALGWIAGHQR